jgi:hypothetical protein
MPAKLTSLGMEFQRCNGRWSLGNLKTLASPWCVIELVLGTAARRAPKYCRGIKPPRE